MNLRTDYCTKNKLQFSLKNATREFSLIRVRMSIERVRFTYYLPSQIKTQYWDKTNGCAIEDPKRNPALKGNPVLQTILRNINKEIEKTTNALIYVIENFKTQNIHPTNEQIKIELDKQLGRIVKRKESEMEVEKKKPFKDFLSFIDNYIAQCKTGLILNSKGLKLAPKTIRNYEVTKLILERYCTNKKIILTFESIDMVFYNNFVKYLNECEHSRGLYKPNVIGKFIKHIKMFMKYAYDNNYTQNNEYSKKGFKVFQENVEKIYLDETELETIYKAELSDSESKVRDAFLISCYTGMRYSDIARLDTSKHIDFEKNVITIITQKTNEKVVIPIHRVVHSILEKYNNKTPRIQSNQATNRLIKIICEKAKIDAPITLMETSGGVRQENTYPKYKLVTSHTARRSFATNAFKQGVPSLSIMQITGHRTETSFMKYIKIGKEENAKSLQEHNFFK
jgi:site-specific recombinase XerD